MRSRKNRSPEEQARRARTRELLKKKTNRHPSRHFFQKAVFSDDGYHEKAEKTAASRPPCHITCHIILALFYAVIWTLHKIWDAAPKENDFLFLLTETSAYRIHGRTYRPLSVSRRIRCRNSALSAPAALIYPL